MTEAIKMIDSSDSDETEVKEANFFRELEKLPKQLAELWSGKYDNLQGDETSFFNEFQKFVDERRLALRGSIEIEDGLDEELVNEILLADSVIRDTFGDQNYFLGNGRVAEVYELPIARHLCVKYVKDQTAYNEGNHLRKEFRFLEDLRKFIVEGVRTPLPYFLNIHPSEGHSYGMEKINGKSLSQILERSSDNIEYIKLVKKMDKEKVKNQVISYIKSMHEEFNITHGDLFQRNIMLDGEGNFYIIDFGKAEVEEVGEDHERRRSIDVATITSEIGVFFQDIDKIDIS